MERKRNKKKKEKFGVEVLTPRCRSLRTRMMQRKRERRRRAGETNSAGARTVEEDEELAAALARMELIEIVNPKSEITKRKTENAKQ